MNKIDTEELNIMYEDNHILVVVKPQNVPSCPDDSGDDDLLSALKRYLVEKYNKPGDAFLGLVHRLDRPTGGVMVFAKTSKAAARLSESIRAGQLEKKYLAVTCGAMRDKKGVLKNALYKDESTNSVCTRIQNSRRQERNSARRDQTHNGQKPSGARTACHGGHADIRRR